jgi:hypothetical protein
LKISGSSFMVPVEQKFELMQHPEDQDKARTEVQYIREEVVKHYATVLYLFDKAIESLEEAEPYFQDATARRANRSTTPPGDHPSKRKGDPFEVLPWAKRRTIDDSDSSPTAPEEAGRWPLSHGARPLKTPTPSEKFNHPFLAKL